MKKLIFTIISLFTITFVNAQITFDTLTVVSNLNSFDYIFEGEVIEQNSYQDVQDNMIYTANLIQISKIFKGNLTCGTVLIITPGGRYQNQIVNFSHVDRVDIGFKGIFGCVQATYLFQNVTSTPSNADILRYVQSYNGTLTYYEDPFNYIAQGFGVSTDDVNAIYMFLQAYCGVIFTDCNTNFKPNIDLPLKKANFYSKSKTRATPTITNINGSNAKPAKINGGTQDTVTLNGSSFGILEGKIFVANADDGGNSFVPLNTTDFITWTDTQITFIMPGIVDSYSSITSSSYRQVTPGSGKIYIQTFLGGISDTSSISTALNTIDIQYSLSQIIDIDGIGTSLYKANLFDYTDTTNFDSTGGYVFQLHDSITDTRMINCIKTAMRRWSCLTGVNFSLATGTTSDTIRAQDDKNIIQLKKPPVAGNKVALTTTSTFNSTCYDSNNNYNKTPVRSIDIYIDPSFNWWFDTLSKNNTTFIPPNGSDFYCTILHELGHAHCLNHINNELGDVMWWISDKGKSIQIPTSIRNLNLNSANQNGGDIIMKNSTDLGMCSFAVYTPMTELDTFCRLTPLVINSFNIKYPAVIYPNPTTDKINIDLSNFPRDIYKIQLTDIFGKSVSKTESTNRISFLNLKLASGIYFINISNKSVNQTYKVQWID
jgi:hypothetical protein